MIPPGLSRRRMLDPHGCELIPGLRFALQGRHEHGLSTVVRGSGNPRTRARLYRKIGQAWEAARDFDRAYDSYLAALELDPGESHARRRIDEMQGAAGL